MAKQSKSDRLAECLGEGGRGTWTLNPEQLQRMANEVVATVVRLAADSNDEIPITVGKITLGSVYCTTRYTTDEVIDAEKESR